MFADGARKAAVMLGLALGALLAQPNPANRPAQLRAVSSSRRLQNVNRNDARLALKVWLDVIARQKGFSTDSVVDILDNLNDIRGRLLSRSVELVTLGVFDFLEMEKFGLLRPVMTDARSGQKDGRSSYVLLARRSSPPVSIASLQGKNILVYSRGGDAIAKVWLEVLLSHEKLGRASSFFASVKTPDKAQACILPLFFGAADACVVDETELNLAREMNPQLGQLQELARSRPLVENILSVPLEPCPYQKELLEAMLSLQEDARGRQLLMVFKTERLVQIRSEDLDSARELRQEYLRLLGSSR